MSNVEKLMTMFDTLDEKIKQLALDRDELRRELTAALAERDAARECLREAMKWILDNPYIDGLKKKWRAAAGLG